MLVRRTYEIEGRLMKWDTEERRTRAMTGQKEDSGDSESDVEG